MGRLEMTRKSLQFETFTLDLERLCLHGPSGRAELRPKSFEVLRYLVEHAGRVVTKDELLRAIWPDVTVTDESLTQCIRDVRRALGGPADRQDGPEARLSCGRADFGKRRPVF